MSLPRRPATAAALPGDGGRGVLAGTWHCSHGATPGSYDETARRASHEELAVAKLLVAAGHRVRTVPESRGARSPDLMACGVGVEVKSFQSLALRGGRPPTAEGVANKLLDARGQGALAVIWGPTSGLAEATARSGFNLFCQKAAASGLGRLRDARIVGPDFDFSLSAVAAVRLAPGATKPAPPRTTRDLEKPSNAAARSVHRPAENGRVIGL